LAQFVGVRDGADNTGYFELRSILAGATRINLRGYSDGRILLPYGPLQIVDANQVIEKIGSGLMQSKTLAGANLVSGKTGAYLLANAYHDGTNYQRYDTAKPAAMIKVSDLDGKVYIYTAPAGANPITWQGAYEIYHVGNLTPVKFATGSYTGDGTVNRQIAVGFQPKLVWIYPADAGNYTAHAVRIDQVDGRIIFSSTSNTYVVLSNVAIPGVALTTTGFKTADNATDSGSCNKNGCPYRWEAWG